RSLGTKVLSPLGQRRRLPGDRPETHLKGAHVLGQIISAKAAAAVLAGAVATSGAAALGSTIADGQQSHSSAAPTQTSATLSADRQNGPAADDTGKGKGQAPRSRRSRNRPRAAPA